MNIGRKIGGRDVRGVLRRCHVRRVLRCNHGPRLRRPCRLLLLRCGGRLQRRSVALGVAEGVVHGRGACSAPPVGCQTPFWPTNYKRSPTLVIISSVHSLRSI